MRRRSTAVSPNCRSSARASGNRTAGRSWIASADLLRSGWVDVFASDYVPPALVEAAFRCAREGLVGLPEAVGMITSRAAALAGLADRGQLAEGQRADVVRVRVHETLPVVR